MEEAYRYFVFKKNKIEIEYHNSQLNSYRLGLNKFSGLTQQ